ncbi:MAG: capsule biosynthesis GfcC family protein, partial [Pseudomonadota bacterium]
GEVQYSTSHIYEPELLRDDYISRSGGLTQKADKKRIYVVRANGSVIVQESSRWFGRSSTTPIRPGDTVVVPLDADRMNRLTLWTNVSQIIYQLALAAASANAIGVL